MSTRRGYPIIGGPLDGLLAREDDFRPENRDIGRWEDGELISPGGKFSREAKDYAPYNRAGSRPSVPTRIWLHKSLLPA